MVNSKRFFTQGLKRVWEEDAKFQEKAIRVICEKVRDISPDLLIKWGAFYVPNDDYMKHFWGSVATDYQYGLYNDTICRYYQRLVFPIYNMEDEVVAFVGYSDGSGAIDPSAVVKYIYSPERVFNKEDFAFIRRDEYRKAIEDGYIFTIDGLFDKFRLNQFGLHSMSHMGTFITDMHKLMLSFVDNIIVVDDNDSAGSKLFRATRRALKNVIHITQAEVKDVDEFLKSEKNAKKFLETYKEIKREGFLLSHYIS